MYYNQWLMDGEYIVIVWFEGFNKWGNPNSWMVCNGKIKKMMIWGYPHFRKPILYIYREYKNKYSTNSVATLGVLTVGVKA